MTLSLKLSTLAVVLLTHAAGTPSVSANEDDRITLNLFQDLSSSITNSDNKTNPLSYHCAVGDVALFVLDGPYTTYRLSSPPSDSLFDARRATWTPDIRRNSSAVRLNAGENVCWIGGRILARETGSHSKSTKNAKNVGMVINASHASNTVTISGLEIRQTVNGIQIKGDIQEIILKDIAMSNIDGACLTLGHFRSTTVLNSLFDGCGRFLILNGRTTNSESDIVVEDSDSHPCGRSNNWHA